MFVSPVLREPEQADDPIKPSAAADGPLVLMDVQLTAPQVNEGA